jgi:hypothetical protein
MQSPALAIGWELWGRNRCGIAAVAAGLVAAAAARALLPAAASAETVVALSAAVFPVAALYLLSVVTHCEFNGGRLRLGLPARLFTLPVRTASLVAWLMLYGVGALTLLWAAAAVLVWIPAGVEPAWWLIPLLAVALVWFQAVCWAVPGPPPAKVLAACVAFPALKFALEMIATAVVLFVLHETRVDRAAVARARPVVLTAFAAGFIPLAYVVAVVGVARARRGAGVGRPRLWQRTGHAPARPAAPRPPFRSPARAQLWFEWRRGGVVLPMFPACFLLFLTAVVAPFVGAGQFGQAILVLVALVVAVAFFAGYGSGKASFWAGDFGLPASQATRPLGSGGLATTKLGAAALSALAATAVVVLGVPLWLGLLGRAGEAAGWLAPHLSGFDGPRLGALAVLGGAGLFALTWGQLIGGLVPALTGRAWVVNAVVATYLTAAAGLGLLARHVHLHPDALAPSVAALSWSCGALAGVKLLAAGCVLRATRRGGLLSRRAAAATLAAWSAGVGCLLALAGLLLPAELQPLTAAAVLLVPLVRPLAAPLALAWNRHR